MPDGYPFDLGFIEKHLSPKETYTKLKKAGAFKQAGAFKNFSVDALKKEARFHEKLSNNPKTSYLQAILFVTFLRQALFSSLEPRWGSSVSAEWKVLDLYCLSRFNKPFYSLEQDHVSLDELVAQNNADTDTLDGLFKITTETVNYQNAFFKEVEEINEGRVPFQNALKMCGLILKDIKDNKNIELAMRAAWALSTIGNTPIVLTAILAVYPEHNSYLEGLRWVATESNDEQDSSYNEVMKELDVYDPKFNTFLDRDQQVLVALQSKYTGLRSNMTDLADVVSSIEDDRGIAEFAAAVHKVDKSIVEIKDCLSTSSAILISNSTVSLKENETGYLSLLEKANELHPESELKNASWSELHKAIDKYRELCPDELIKKLGGGFISKQMPDLMAVISNQVDAAQSINDQISKLSVDSVKNRSALSKKFIEYDETLLNVTNEVNCFANSITEEVESINKINIPEKPKKQVVEIDELSIIQGKLDKETEKNTLLESKIDTYKNEKIQLSDQLHKEQLKTASVNVIDKTISSGGDDWIRGQMRSGEFSIPQVLSATEALYGDRIVILDSVKALASSVVFKRPSRLSELLFQLCDEYAPSITGGMADAEARKCFSANAYAAGESDSTLSISRLKKIRMHEYNGKEYLFEQHLRSGNSSNATQSLRVYFKIINGTVVISHVGEHLECYTTI